jgi:hypothetical protein
VKTLADVLALAEGLKLAPNLTPFFGDRTDVTVFEVEGLGWAVSLGYEKASVHPSHQDKPFRYAVAFQIPFGSSRREATLLAKDGFVEFMNHEIEEGVVFDGERPLDPHWGMKGRLE